MDEPEDIDMTSSTLLPALNHDRQDAVEAADMDMDQPQPGQTLVAPVPNAENAAGDTVEVEAMDTTPDPTPAQVAVEPSQAEIVSPASPRPTEASETQNGEALPPTTTTQPDGVVEGNGVVTPPAGIPPPGSDPAVIEEETRSTPEAGTGTSAEDRDDDDSSEEDENGQGWHEIIEDTSAPDEQELKEIEEAPEHSALERKFRFRLLGMIFY
jgi:hypothetical protein